MSHYPHDRPSRRRRGARIVVTATVSAVVASAVLGCGIVRDSDSAFAGRDGGTGGKVEPQAPLTASKQNEIEPHPPSVGSQPDSDAGAEGVLTLPPCTAAGARQCGGQCVDVSSNPAHCGGCDSPCTPGIPCIGGACAAPGETSMDGSSEVSTSTCRADLCEPNEYGTFLMPGCCASEGRCGYDLSDRYPPDWYPAALPICVPAHTEGTFDDTCPLINPFFPACCSEFGRCGGMLAHGPDVGCIEAVDAPPCTPSPLLP